jgi:hypothetical protein
MQTAIGYLRVSTQEQDRSGLGLAAQRFEIQALGAREDAGAPRFRSDVRAAHDSAAPDTRELDLSRLYSRNLLINAMMARAPTLCGF